MPQRIERATVHARLKNYISARIVEEFLLIFWRIEPIDHNIDLVELIGVLRMARF